jgi:hypothetical protein
LAVVPASGWYGYVVTGSTYTSTTADWTMPSLACVTKEFTVMLSDVTRGWSHTVNQSLAAAARTSAETVVEVPADLSCAPAQTLAAFTGDTVNGSPLGSQDPVKVTGTNPHITVSAVSGKTFSVTCDGSAGA